MPAEDDGGDSGEPLLVIPRNLKETGPFAARFISKEESRGSYHVIDLAQARFTTEPLVASVKAAGLSRFQAPDLSPYLPQLLTEAFERSPEDYFFVQALSPEHQIEIREFILSEETVILDYIPLMAYLVRGSQDQMERISRHSSVMWVGFFQTAWRYSPKVEWLTLRKTVSYQRTS